MQDVRRTEKTLQREVTQQVEAGEKTISVGAGGGDAVLIPYEQIVRGNLIDEGSK